MVDDRYTIVSADGHAGGDLRDYRPYLPARLHDEFDAWADSYVNPFADLLAATAYRNFDSERRLAEASRMGMTAAYMSERGGTTRKNGKMRVHGVRNVADLFKTLFA